VRALPAKYDSARTQLEVEFAENLGFLAKSSSLLLWGEGPQGHRIKPLITQHKQDKRHTNKSKQM